METTRHFVATVYVVNDGATALHRHEKLDMWLPPGGHVDRDELPHETAKRETREETGLEPTLLSEAGPIESGTVRELPQPQQLLLEDIDYTDEGVAHQHVDSVFYGHVDAREIDPAPGETAADAWEWFTPAELRANRDRLEPDVVQVGQDAIERVDAEF